LKSDSLLESFNYAIEGIIHVLRTQRNMRIHFIVASTAILLGLFLDISRLEWIIILLTVSIVFLAEMVNTAIELSMDVKSDTYHPLARIVKDVAAGGVLISSLISGVVGYLIFFERFRLMMRQGMERVRLFPTYLTLATLIIVLIAVIAGKAFFGRGKPLRGGIPSGHSAIAFSMWVAVTFITENPLVSLICFALAFLVAESRVAAKIHRKLEVITGAVLGTLVTTLLFQIFS
jgi:diacylglycerol kinase (ATP)